jgi:hypothetical protein
MYNGGVLTGEATAVKSCGEIFVNKAWIYKKLVKVFA